jgi:hypothetical protein
MIANKCESLVSAYFLYPTQNINMVTPETTPTTHTQTRYSNLEYDDNKTVVTSNKTHKREQPPATMAATAHNLFGNPMPQYLNAITIATNQAIADTGATSIFIMDGVEVENKRLTRKP